MEGQVPMRGMSAFDRVFAVWIGPWTMYAVNLTDKRNGQDFS